jgi:hypothetical protein
MRPRPIEPNVYEVRTELIREPSVSYQQSQQGQLHSPVSYKSAPAQES